MKILIEIPKEFERDFNEDKFKDFFERVRVDLDNNTGVNLCGNYEREIVDMLENTFQNARELEQGKSNYEEDLDL